MRLLIVSNVFPPQIIGGAEIVAQRQALAFAAMGYDVYVLGGELSPRPSDLPHLYLDMVEGIRVFRIATSPVRSEENHRRPELSDFFKLVFSVIRPEVVHMHNLPGLGTDIVALAKQAGATVMMTMHDAWGFCLRQTTLRPNGRLCQNTTECDVCQATIKSDRGDDLPIRMRRDYVRWCLEQADLMIFPSRSLRDAYVETGFDKVKCRVLSNGISLEEFAPRQRAPQDRVSFLCASTLGDHKGVRVLWEALELLLLDTHLKDRWDITLAGEGPLAPDLQSRFDGGALHEPVEWAGFIPRAEMPATVDRADVVILTSIWPENEPVALLEAMASGAAQLGTDIGGIPELIENERSGLIVPPGDALALAEAMRRLILNPALVSAFSARNLERRDQFDGVRSVETLSQLFTGRSLPPVAPSRLIVLCWGQMSDVSTGSDLSYRLRKLDSRIQMIWHEWIEPDSDLVPNAVCVFGDLLPLGALGRAMLFDAPIILPAKFPIDNDDLKPERIRYYETELDALNHLGELALSL